MTMMFEELIKSSPFAIIDLYELHLNAAVHGTNEIYRFHNGGNGKFTNTGEIIWKGNSYIALPVQAEGFEYSGNGQLPRPKLRVANLLSTITAIMIAVNETTPGNDLTGAKFIRIRTLSRFLDPVNFDGGVNPFGTPDPDAEAPQEIYYVDRKTAETRDVVEFELAAAFDLAGVRAPKRQCISNICQWEYRGAECGYTGTNYFDENDTPLNSAAAPNFPAGSATLSAGSSIFLEQQIVSANGWYIARVGPRGDFFIRDKSQQQSLGFLWQTNTGGLGGYRLTMQTDGNLVLYTSGNAVVWQTNTANLGAPTSITYLNWLPDDIRAGRNGAFFHEVLGNADSYSAGTNRTANYTFNVGSRSITLQLSATCETIPSAEAPLYPSATRRWRQTSGSGAAATVVSSTGLWRLNETFSATITTSLGNPFRAPVGYGTLTTVSAVYQVNAATGFANRAVIQNDANLVLLTAGDVQVWQAGISQAGEPRIQTGTGDPLKDVCGKRLTSCKLRFGENAEIPFGSFPGIGGYV
jgi:lambda family phage minor tail protein L